jgi:hypothetical protein
MRYNREEYDTGSKIEFRLELSKKDNEDIANVIHNVLHKFKSPKETIPYVESEIASTLAEIHKRLDEFFGRKPGEYFLRFSNCSPKDAWYQLCSETPELDEEQDDQSEDILTEEEIKRDIDVLRVTSAKQVLMVLCHSERIYYEAECDKGDNAIILLPWNDKILYDTETRCFVRNGKLIAFSQYYYGLQTGYKSLKCDFPGEFCLQVTDKINTITSNNFPYKDAVIDLAVSSKHTKDDLEFIFIEVNPFDENTDSPFIDWKHLQEDEFANVEFKYKKEGEIKSYNL